MVSISPNLSIWRTTLAHFGLLVLLTFFVGCSSTTAKSLSQKGQKGQKERTSPNIIVIFTDDQGYGDLGSFGGQHVNTPNLDKMAEEGIRLTSFYVAAPICTPSRAALLTGSYPKRNGMAKRVFLAGDHQGLHPDEITIAEVLKQGGYTTGMFGKWHLGDQPEFLPTRQGFDSFFGLPYSHDIQPKHPNKRHQFPPLPLLEGETVVELNPDASLLTQRITERAVDFISKNKNKPFFLYLPHVLPHRPVYASAKNMASVDPKFLQAIEDTEQGGTFDYKRRASCMILQSKK